MEAVDPPWGKDLRRDVGVRGYKLYESIGSGERRVALPAPPPPAAAAASAPILFVCVAALPSWCLASP